MGNKFVYMDQCIKSTANKFAHTFVIIIAWRSIPDGSSYMYNNYSMGCYLLEKHWFALHVYSMINLFIFVYAIIEYLLYNYEH